MSSEGHREKNQGKLKQILEENLASRQSPKGKSTSSIKDFNRVFIAEAPNRHLLAPTDNKQCYFIKASNPRNALKLSVMESILSDKNSVLSEEYSYRIWGLLEKFTYILDTPRSDTEKARIISNARESLADPLENALKEDRIRACERILDEAISLTGSGKLDYVRGDLAELSMSFTEKNYVSWPSSQKIEIKNESENKAILETASDLLDLNSIETDVFTPPIDRPEKERSTLPELLMQGKRDHIVLSALEGEKFSVLDLDREEHASLLPKKILGMLSPVEIGPSNEKPIDELLAFAKFDEFFHDEPEAHQVFQIESQISLETIKRSDNAERANEAKLLAHLFEGKRILVPIEAGLPEIKKLRKEFPNFQEVIDFIEDHLIISHEFPDVGIPPILLNGPPGSGKTRFSEKLAKAIGTAFKKIAPQNCQSSFNLAGGARSWSEARVGKIAEIFLERSMANPVILFDELEKVGGDNRFPVLPVFLNLLEVDTAKSFEDEFLGIELDVSKAIYIGTANRVQEVDPALYDRFRIFNIREYTLEEKTSIFLNSFNSKFGTKVFLDMDEAKKIVSDNDFSMRDIPSICVKLAAHKFKNKLTPENQFKGTVVMKPSRKIGF